MDEPGSPASDAVERLRRESEGRLSGLQVLGTDARLRRAMRHPVRLEGQRAGAPAPAPADAGTVLTKAARRTGRWLGLTASEFEAATGLPCKGIATPGPGSAEWRRCLALVRLGYRLEAKLGRRGVVRTWLRGRHLQLVPTPTDVLTGPGGAAALNAYLDAFER